MSIFDNEEKEQIFQMGIDETAKSYMLETARWTKFLAITAFILLGLAGIVIMIAASTSFGLMGSSYGAGGPFAFVMLMLMSLLYIYPIFALLKFSTHIKAALNENDTLRFQEAMRYQRNMFKFMGILIIILLAFYGIALLFAGGALLMGGFR